MSSRSEREIIATDHTDMYDNWHKMNTRFHHVFQCPNTVYYRRVFDELVGKDIVGKRVLEIGCGDGTYSEKMLSFGAAYVHGTDISRKRIFEAKSMEIPGRLKYSVADVSEPSDEVFDLIVGRAVLHHLDYREVLQRLYQHNLNDKGMMIFWEPLGSNLLIKAYGAFGKGLHTPDERPFYRKDLRWLDENFRDFRIMPVNYTSLPLGIVSSFIFKKPDNLLLRGADKFDRFLVHKAKFLRQNFRNAVFIIHKS